MKRKLHQKTSEDDVLRKRATGAAEGYFNVSGFFPFPRSEFPFLGMHEWCNMNGGSEAA